MDSRVGFPARETRRQRGVWMLLLFAVPFAAYASALPNEFVGEDDRGIVRNRLIGSLSNLPEIFRHHATWSAGSRAAMVQRATDIYRPIPGAVFFLEYAVVGPDPVLFHLTSVLVHVANVFLLVLLAMRLGIATRVGRVAALLFGVHPAIAEAVHLVNARSDSLALLFFLSALVVWRRRGWPSFLATTLLFFCATLCKETVFLLAACVVFFVERWRAAPKRALFSLIPWVGGGVLGLAARWAALGESAVGATSADWGYALTRVPLIWLDGVRSFLVPAAEIQPSILEAYRDPSPTKIVFAAIVTIGFLFFGAIACKRQRTLALFIICAFLITTAPVALLTRQESWSGWGRYLYLSAPFVLLGIAVMVAEFVLPVATRRLRPWMVATGAALLVFLAAQTFFAGGAYRNNRAFFEAAIADQPTVSVAYANLGELEISEKNYDRALALAEKALSIDSSKSRNWSLAASALMHLGRFPEAYRAASRAVALGVEDARSPYIIAIQHLSERREASAARILMNVISDDPDQKGPWGTLRQALTRFGRHSEFARVLRERVEEPAFLPLAATVRAMLDSAPDAPITSPPVVPRSP